MSTVCGRNTSRRKDHRDDELPGDMRGLLGGWWKGQTRKQINIANSSWERRHVGVREQKKKILNNIIRRGQRRSKNIHWWKGVNARRQEKNCSTFIFHGPLTINQFRWGSVINQRCWINRWHYPKSPSPRPLSHTHPLGFSI